MEGYVYYGTEAGLGWHDSDTGERVSRVELDSPRQGAMDGTIYGLGRDGIVAYDHDDGEPSQRWFTPYEDPDGVEYQLLVEPDPDGDGRTVHLRASDGDTVWERSFGTPASRHAVADGTVYLEARGDLVALDAATGETRWRLPEMGGELALVGDTIYVNGEELYALRA